MNLSDNDLQNKMPVPECGSLRTIICVCTRGRIQNLEVVGGGATSRIRGGLGGHSRNIGLCYKGFEVSRDPLLRVGGARAPPPSPPPNGSTPGTSNSKEVLASSPEREARTSVVYGKPISIASIA